jgi:hypothetical protein
MASEDRGATAKAVAAQFIKIRKGIVSDPDVIQMADLLDLDEFAIVGRLSDIWDWVDSNSADGIGLTASDKWLDRRVQCPGFAAAMRAVGWLAGESGSLTFPHWDRHNSNTAKARALEAEAKRLRRAGDTVPAASDGCPTLVRQPSDKTPGEMSDQSKSKSKSKNLSNTHTPREAEPVEMVEFDEPGDIAPDGRPWLTVEREFCEAWNKLPTGKRGVVPVYGLPLQMSPKDREAFRDGWRAKPDAARQAMRAIADGAIQWDRSAMTIRAFFNSELETILGGGHARHDQQPRNNSGQSPARVDATKDLDALLSRQVDQRSLVGSGR